MKKVLKKRKGMALLIETVLVCLMLSLIGMSVLDIQSSSLKNADASSTGYKAQFLAVTKLNEINVTPYVNLKDEARAVVPDTNGFEREVIMGPEVTLPDNNRQRKMTVNVYKGSENLPRYSCSVSPAVRETPFWAGMIIIYSGNLADIPAGWALCDGTHGTPDLRGKFVVGQGSNTDRGITVNFGYHTSNVTMYHQHTVTGSTDGHALTIDEMPRHNHSGASSINLPTIISGGTGGFDMAATAAHGHKDFACNINIAYDGNNQPHSHTLTNTTVSNQYHIPPYYALAYIMKI